MSIAPEDDSSTRIDRTSSHNSSTLPRAAGSRTARKSILKTAPSSDSSDSPAPDAGPSTPQRPSALSHVTTPRRSSSQRPKRSSSEPGLSAVLETPVANKGKRKAEDVDITPPDHKTGQHTKFVEPENGRRAHLQSEPSRAPSSFSNHKRARLSTYSPTPSPGHSRPSSSQQNGQNAATTGSWSSRTGTLPPPLLKRPPSRAPSNRSTQPPTPTNATHPESRRDRRRSISEVSIPISALITPHAPSISRSSTYHMRDPQRPPRIQSTPWSLRLRSQDEEGSPVHAWCFFIGFILFPLWWVASFVPIPRTRRVGGTDTEKAVTLDDPQVEHDARSWRLRCRIMSVVSILTYIPFIVLIAIFAPR